MFCIPMKSIDILKTTLEKLTDKEHYLFSVSDFYSLFNNLSKPALTVLLNRAVKSNILERACKGVFIYPKAEYEKGYELYHIAAKLRETEFCYLSCENILSQNGIISQIPIGYITLMTTGRSGIINCGKYGTIEFIHTKKNVESLHNKITYNYKYKLWCAKIPLAYKDMKITKKSLDLVNKDMLNEFI